MPYLGKSPQHGNYSKLDDFSGDFDGSDATHAVASNSIAITPVRPEALIISINGVIQEPTTDYTVSGTNITFTTAPTSGDSFFGVALGEQLQIGTPSDATITSAKLTGNLVTPGTLDVNGQELILDADGDTTITADTDDTIDIKIAGADDFQFTANTLTALSGSTVAIASGATIANSGTATGFGGGKIGQVLQAIKTDRTSFSFSTSNTYSTITGLTQAITCAATSSKVLVSGYVSYHAVPSANGTIHFAFFRDSTQIGSGSADASRNPSAISYRQTGGTDATEGQDWYAYGFKSSAFEFLDSPSSTSAVTYSMKVTFGATYSGVIIINGTDVATGGSQLDYQPAASSAITVMEVLA